MSTSATTAASSAQPARSFQKGLECMCSCMFYSHTFAVHLYHPDITRTLIRTHSNFTLWANNPVNMTGIMSHLHVMRKNIDIFIFQGCMIKAVS